MKRLAIITTHPIQYNSPLFELLTRRNKIAIRVFYTWGESVLQDKYDPGFKKVINWDIPLLQGYDYTFLKNTSKEKGSHHFNGIKNPEIIQSINSFRPHALLVYGWSFVSHLKVMRHFKKNIPVLFRGASNLLDNTAFFRNVLRNVCLKFVYRYIDKALYVGKSNYDYFVKAGLKRPQLIFAPHAIDNDRFRCGFPGCRSTAQALRTALKIKVKDFVFLFAGKLEEKKNPALLLEAFAQCGFQKGIHLVITGNGVLETDLKKKYSGYQGIHFLDFQNQLQMPSVYEMGDVFVLPSKGPGETWGLSVNEAMANGKAVIVSNKCGCAADLVENNLNGFIFKSGNLGELRELLKKIQADKITLENMGAASAKKIKEYTFENLAKTIEATVIDSITPRSIKQR